MSASEKAMQDGAAAFSAGTFADAATHYTTATSADASNFKAFSNRSAAFASLQKYEEALAEGDAPALLEAGPGGLHTANLGNLKPGEQVVLEIRFAQLVAFDQGRLRLAIPTTIAPRSSI